jgi:iron complex outermembrane recepter protein
MKPILSAVVGATLALSTAQVGAAGRATDRQVTLSIHSVTLADALDMWAARSGFQILVWDWDTVQKLAAPTIKGTYSAQVALEKLLEGTSLTYRWVNDRTVAIREKPQPAVWSKLVPPQTQALELGEAAGTGQVLDPGSDGQVHMAGGAASGLADDVVALEEIIVTGTHIRGTPPAGSPLIVIDRKDIERSGRSRVQDVLEVLPQNFAGSAGERFQTDNKAANNTRGQAVDLRGLGASSTLVLINGRRQPSGGLEGAFVDISSIPTVAIDRIEVLPDGASALYGADAIGGVVNFILRKRYDGLETAARYGSTTGGSDELQASVVGGMSWDSGNFILGYQYLDREALMAADTFYGARNNDFRGLGGSDFRTAGGNPGTIVDPLTFLPAYAIPRGQGGTALAVDDLIAGQNYQDDVTGYTVLPEQRQHSAFLALTQSLSDAATFSLEGRFGKRDMTYSGLDDLRYAFVPQTNPYYLNPFGGTDPVVVAYNFGRDLGGTAMQVSDTHTYSVTAGVDARLAAGWSLDVAAAFGEEENEWQFSNTTEFDRLNMCLSGLPDSGCPGAPLNLFGDNVHNDPVTINFIRDGALGRSLSTIRSLSAVADGPAWQLPKGTLKVAIGADYRNERLHADRSILLPYSGEILPDPSFTVGKFDRDVSAVFGEIAIPVLGPDPSGAGRLEVSLAARYEDYSDFGSTTNPKIGISFVPLDGVTLRASWGTSFRAPRFNELSPTSNPSAVFLFPGLPDPQSPTGESNVLYIGGTDPDLHPETADVWTAGFDLMPRGLENFKLSATYFSIDYEDKIQVGGEGITTLLLEDLWAEIITRDPTPEQVAALCARSDFFGDCSLPVSAIIDGRLRNLGGVRVRGIDLSVSYRIPLPLGSLDLRLAGTDTLTYERAVSKAAPFVSALDTVNNPLALRLRGSVGWRFNGWSIDAFVNHAGSYQDPAFNRSVDSYTTVDLALGYRAAVGWLSGTRVALSAINAFDEEPPFVNQIGGFDASNASQQGRVLSVEIAKAW